MGVGVIDHWKIITIRSHLLIYLNCSINISASCINWSGPLGCCFADLRALPGRSHPYKVIINAISIIINMIMIIMIIIPGIVIIIIISIIIIIIIRSVLTRAELEALPLDNNLKEDVEKGKVILMMNSDERGEDLPDSGHPPCSHPYCSPLVTHPC